MKSNFLFSVVILVAALALGACNKKKDEGNLTPGQGIPAQVPGSNNQKPTVNPSAPKTFMEGSWETNCQAENKTQSIKVEGELLGYVIKQYAGDNCTGQSETEYTAYYKFKLTPITGDPVYQNKIEYFKADGTLHTEEKVLLTNNGLSFSAQPNVYLKK